MMDLVSEAIIFAVKAHDGMRRRLSDAPYILHPMEAATIVGSMTSHQEVIAAAALHDVVEDLYGTDDAAALKSADYTDAAKGYLSDCGMTEQKIEQLIALLSK